MAYSPLVGYRDRKSIERLSRLNNLKMLNLKLDSLRDLEELDIGGNKIDKFVVSKGLSKLKSLSLSGTGFKGTFDVRGSFSSLNSLYLSSNNFTETVTITTQELHNFTNLEYLKLDDSPLHISLLQSIASIFPSLKNLSMIGCEVNGVIRGQGFPHFKSLEHLDMEFMHIALNTSFLQIISESMSSLKYSSLSYYTLGINSGGTLNQGLCSLVHLQELYIASNDLRGSLPWCMANMTSLRILDVSSTQLTGSISSSPLVHLTSIEELYLSNNHFRIPISLEPLFNHSRLKVFWAKNNEINAEITQSHSLTAPNFQLSRLSLSSGYGDGVIFPKFLYHQHDLEYVDLSHIKMNGEFPTWLLENNAKLETLFLINDSIGGPFRLPIHPHRRLRFLDVSNNNFQGHIPVEVGDILPSLFSFNISTNALHGSIPSSFGNMNFLRILDLSSNQLTGEIPERLAVGCVNLEFLALSNNNLKGHMFCRNFNLANLRRLQLEDNRFIGEIPQSLSKCSSLEGLYLNNNSLSGKIPRWLGNLTSLQHITMPKNHLEGPIPVEFCQLYSLHILDISDNNISGRLDLSCNKLIGHIPPQIGNLTGIQTLNLSHNSLIGSIPSTLSNLEQIESLDISYNKLIGKIPHQLVELKALAVFSVAYNNLSDEIPKWKAQFATFNESSYEGNTFLCGFPLPICKSPATMSEASTSNEGDDNLIDIDSFFITFTPSYVIVIFAIVVVLYVNPYWRRRWFYLIEMWISSCYYSVVDNLIPRRFCH
ncbi:hypothetical protein CUMW_149780 [Citrus unshiu]|nr:hypothetical protein CUMW_149780 [Citrus unshiu]